MGLRKEDFTPTLIEEVKHRVAAGEYQHKIAADIDCNQGRISEIKNDDEWVVAILEGVRE